jgi:uncharacterized protein YjiS (DUF1127 family)
VLRDCIDSKWLLPIDLQPNRLRWTSPRRLLTTFAAGVLQWRERARSRRLLQRLDDRMLRDVGLSRSDADREGAKHFWQG